MPRSGAPYLNQDISVFVLVLWYLQLLQIEPEQVMKKLELRDYKKKNKNLSAKSYSRCEPVGVGYLPVCKHYFLFCYIVCVRAKKQTQKNQPKKKTTTTTKKHQFWKGRGDRVWSQISDFKFLFSIFDSLTFTPKLSRGLLNSTVTESRKKKIIN